MKTKRVKRLLSLFLAVCLAVSLAPGVLAYSGTGYCQVCRATYSYTLKYGNETDATHQEIHTCANCGYDQLAGLGTISNHNLIYYSAAYDQCTYCGMLISRNGPTCAHTNFTVRWNVCDWQKYCKNCGYIQYIEVHQAEKVNGVWEQHLTIHYNCIGAIDIPDALQITMPEVTMNTRKGVYVSYVPNGQTVQVGV